jgi:hypothetical protein
MIDKHLGKHIKNKASFSSVQDEFLQSRENELIDSEFIQSNIRSHGESGPNIINIQQRTQEYEDEIEKLKGIIKTTSDRESQLLERIHNLEHENSKFKKDFDEILKIVKNNSIGNKRDSIDSKEKEVSKPEENIVKSIKEVFSFISQLEKLVKEQAKEVDYLRQKENKLMYLFFILHRKGVNVNEVYDSELKDVPTERFNEWIKEHMDDDEPPEISFDSQASYSPIHKSPMPRPKKPTEVPTLNFEAIPDYITSSSEDENNDSSLLQNKKSLDGSKLHRQSEINSDLSMSFYVKGDESIKHYKEEYSLSEEIKINRNYKPKAKMQSSESLEKLEIPVSQSLNTDQLNFNM